MRRTALAWLVLGFSPPFTADASPQASGPVVELPRVVEPRQPDGPFEGLYSWSERATAPHWRMAQGADQSAVGLLL